jgi:N-acetylneuraminic acid mutarotase
MKKIYTLIFICFTLFVKADYWTQKANLPSPGLDNPFSFIIGNKGYVGCGETGLSFQNEFWEYDPAANVWTQKANFAGVARIQASGFSIGNKGYAGVGSDPGNNAVQDFWEYDPSTNVWSQKANFGYQIAPVGFSIGSMGYMGIGIVAIVNELWQYNPANNTWSQKATMPGATRGEANCFVIGNNAYVIGGFTQSFSYLSDVWEYNSISNTWTQKANLPSFGRCEAASFSICGKGYCGTGYKSTGSLDDFWQYNPVTNSWIQKTNYGGNPSGATAYFSIGTKGYVGLGYDGSPTNVFWEYTPDSSCATGIEEEFSTSSVGTNFQFSISPNPAKELIVISYPPALYLSELPGKEKIEIAITDIQGKKVYQTKPETLNHSPETTIDISQFPKGIYFAEVSSGKQKAVRKFVKE